MIRNDIVTPNQVQTTESNSRLARSYNPNIIMNKTVKTNNMAMEKSKHLPSSSSSMQTSHHPTSQTIIQHQSKLANTGQPNMKDRSFDQLRTSTGKQINESSNQCTDKNIFKSQITNQLDQLKPNDHEKSKRISCRSDQNAVIGTKKLRNNLQGHNIKMTEIMHAIKANSLLSGPNEYIVQTVVANNYQNDSSHRNKVKNTNVITNRKTIPKNRITSCKNHSIKPNTNSKRTSSPESLPSSSPSSSASASSSSSSCETLSVNTKSTFSLNSQDYYNKSNCVQSFDRFCNNCNCPIDDHNCIICQLLSHLVKCPCSPFRYCQHFEEISGRRSHGLKQCPPMVCPMTTTTTTKTTTTPQPKFANKKTPTKVVYSSGSQCPPSTSSKPIFSYPFPQLNSFMPSPFYQNYSTSNLPQQIHYGLPYYQYP
ncbi:unnamed protein product [Schistosoma turkestanicum]|nr:unnamed protein product [Schistosoma turkestanicum]